MNFNYARHLLGETVVNEAKWSLRLLAKDLKDIADFEANQSEDGESDMDYKAITNFIKVVKMNNKDKIKKAFNKLDTTTREKILVGLDDVDSFEDYLGENVVSEAKRTPYEAAIRDLENGIKYQKSKGRDKEVKATQNVLDALKKKRP